MCLLFVFLLRSHSFSFCFSLFFQRFSTVHLLWSLQEFSLTRRSLGDKRGPEGEGVKRSFFLSTQPSLPPLFFSGLPAFCRSCALSVEVLDPCPVSLAPGERGFCVPMPLQAGQTAAVEWSSPHTHTHTLYLLPAAYSAHRQKCKGMVSRNFNEDKVQHAMEAVALEWPVLTHFTLRKHLRDNKRSSRATVSFIQLYREWRLI